MTRKITRAAARIKLGLQDKLFLGNLDAVRDWGYAPEYVEAMWLMLQSNDPTDCVISTGVGVTVKEFLEASFGSLGLEWTHYVEQDPTYFRPTEVDALIGDSSKAQKLTSWFPETSGLKLAEKMTEQDLMLCKKPDFVDVVSWRF